MTNACIHCKRIAVTDKRPYHAVMSTRVKVAVAQMSACVDAESNLKKMESLVSRSADQGATVVAFPEMAYLVASNKDLSPTLTRYDQYVSVFSEWARSFRIEVLAGTIREPIGQRYFNTLLYFDASGKLAAKYRKIHLFKAALPDRHYDEALYCTPGDSVEILNTSWGSAGLAVCFDLRFPELFRALKKRGAQVIFLPSAFTVPTGEAHWFSLLKARAIENQVFIVAPALVGRCGDGRETFGHSAVISPWGDTRLDMGLQEGLSVVELALSEIGECAKKVDAWACCRDDLFPWA